MIVFLWRADGADRCGRGISDQAGSARRAARDCLRSGAASSAVVEVAVSDLGMKTLEESYYRTGRGWRAKVGGDGRVWWVPIVGGAKAGAA